MKYRWRLTVEPAERHSIAQRFRSCPAPALHLPKEERAAAPASQGGGGGTEKTDPRFDSCTPAIEAGYGPTGKEYPEYWWYTDGDGDGTNCES